MYVVSVSWNEKKRLVLGPVGRDTGGAGDGCAGTRSSRVLAARKDQAVIVSFGPVKSRMGGVQRHFARA